MQAQTAEALLTTVQADPVLVQVILALAGIEVLALGVLAFYVVRRLAQAVRLHRTVARRLRELAEEPMTPGRSPRAQSRSVVAFPALPAA